MNFDFITENIAVGQKINSLEFAEALRAAGITHVLNLFAGDEETFWTGSVCYVPQEDDGTPRTREQVFAAIICAIAVFNAGGKLYIHCQWGLGRAPSACYAILRKSGLSPDEAISLINRKRPRCARWDWQQYIPSIEEALSRKP
jgi:protein-tyrosine phosphatase